MAKNPLRQKIESHATGKRYINAVSANMREIYSTVRARMMAKIAEQATSGKVSVPFSGKHLVALSETIQRQYADLEEELRATMKYAVPYVAQGYYAMALADSGSKVVGGFSQLRVDAMLQDSFSHIAGATQIMRDADIRHLRNIAAKVFRETSITGETRRQVSQRLMGEALKLPDFAFVDKAGRKWGNQSYFDMLGRTVLLNTSRSTYIDTCAEKGKDVVVVSVSGAPCPKCRVWERRLLSVTGNTPGLPTVEQATQAGLFHPNCTHSITAVPDYSRKRKYDANGRPLDGWNSKGEAQVDDADAWRKYRLEHTGEKGKYVKIPKSENAILAGMDKPNSYNDAVKLLAQPRRIKNVFNESLTLDNKLLDKYIHGEGRDKPDPGRIQYLGAAVMAFRKASLGVFQQQTTLGFQQRAYLHQLSPKKMMVAFEEVHDDGKRRIRAFIPMRKSGANITKYSRGNRVK